MDDLFPETRQPEALGADLIPHTWPTFFAIYPNERDLLRVVDWQRGIRNRSAVRIAPRPSELLHVSVAECGRAKRKRQPLRATLAEAARHFVFPAFDIVFDAIARFGKDGRACVAIADAASQRLINDLRIALADAQRHAGLFVARGNQDAHLTLGYGDGLSQDRLPIVPFGFRVTAVELVASEAGKSRHEHLECWRLAE